MSISTAGQRSKLTADARLASELYDLAEALVLWGNCYWQFWEQEERAYATCYGDVLQELVKVGTIADLNNLMLSLAREPNPFTLRLLKHLRAIRKDEEPHDSRSDR